MSMVAPVCRATTTGSLLSTAVSAGLLRYVRVRTATPHTKFQLPQAAPTTVKWQAALSPELARWARETCEASEFAFANSLPHSSHQASLPAPTFKASLPAPTSKSSEQRWEGDICNPRSQSHSCSNTMHAIRPAHYMHVYQSHHISPSHQAISP